MAKSELERKLEEIDALHKEGVLTDSEYETARQRAIQTSEIGQPPAPEAASPTASSRSSRFGCGKTLLVIIGVLVGVVIVIGIIAAVVGGGDDSTPASNGSEPAATATPRSGFMRVGSVEIQVLAVETFDATPYNIFNDENLRIHVRVQKIRGDEYDFTLNEWVLITSAGTGIDHSRVCTDCPDPIDELVIYGDQPVEAYVYFELPPGRHAFTELRYEPFASTNEGRVPLSATVTITIGSGTGGGPTSSSFSASVGETIDVIDNTRYAGAASVPANLRASMLAASSVRFVLTDPLNRTTTYTFEGRALSTRQTVAASNGLPHYMIYNNGMIYFRWSQSGRLNFIDRVSVSW